MLADDDLLLDDLGEEAERTLQLVERRALTDLDSNDASRPADAATNPAQVFLLASCKRFD
jgi:hypothetical protein